MTLLDASVLIDFLRTKDLQLLAQMQAAGGAVCGVTRAEILSGARGPKDLANLIVILDSFQQVSIPNAMWDTIGDLQSQLRANGVTVPLADATVASVAIALDAEAWARDAHFPNMQKILPALKLFVESP